MATLRRFSLKSGKPLKQFLKSDSHSSADLLRQTQSVRCSRKVGIVPFIGCWFG